MQRCSDPHCGHLNRPSARFCSSCGRPLREQPAETLQAGHELRGGAYRIVEPLGRGGMGALYLAADTGAFDRRCVVKELLDYYDPADPDEARQAQARFEREARLLAELSHPGIPRIYSYFSEAGRHYIVMEYIEGENLERALTHTDADGRAVAARPLAPEEVVRHAVRICKVLEYLAERPTPVIHHDIKPANLIVDRTSGEVRLVDFGTAQLHSWWAAQAGSRGRDADPFGTKGYAAPEQYQGHSEPRSDVYALAATVYHLLTDDDPGDHPFQFGQMASLPGPLADALRRALRPEVQRRSTALEFRHALQAWLIPDESAQPFVFRDGTAAQTTEELVALCEGHWAEARQHLADGHFDQWFRARNRHDLVAKSRSARLEHDPDAALDAFLRRLNPRLATAQLSIAPDSLDFGRLTRTGEVGRQIIVGNTGRGYGQMRFSASVPWIRFDPAEVGCLSGAHVATTVWLDARPLPLRRDHQAVITCMPARGERISVPVAAELNPLREVLRQSVARLWELAHLCGRAAQRGLALWSRTFRSLIRSRYGRWILMGETLLLLASILMLWWTAGNRAPALTHLLPALAWAIPLALLVIWAAPAVGFAVGAIAWELLRLFFRQSKPTQG